MVTIQIGVNAMTRSNGSIGVFTSSRFLLDIPAGTDVFVYHDGKQQLSDAVKDAWLKQYGKQWELNNFCLS